MQVEQWPVDKPIPYARNARKISDAAVDKVAGSLKEFGWRQPLVVDAEGVLIVGHTRLLAAKKLGMDEVPVHVAKMLTPAQVKAYRLADNRTGEEALWDNELLSLELGEVAEDGWLLDLTGFDSDEVESLLDVGEGSGTAGDDECPGVDDEAEPDSKPGGVYELGPHRLVCGDSTDAKHVAKLVGDELVDLWLTDPPYNVAYEGKTEEALTIENDEMDDGEFRAFLNDAFKAACDAMRPGAAFYIWHADSEGYNFRGACRDVDLQVRQCLIWNKNSMVLGRQDYHWKHEPCLYGWKAGAGHTWSADRKQVTILDFDRPSRSTDHPTMKPVDLFSYQVKNNTGKGDVVLDTFGGSGTTLIACASTGRVCRMMELDPKYCDVIRKRWTAWAIANDQDPGTGRLDDANQ